MSCAKGCCSSQGEHYRGVALRPVPTPQTQKEKALATDLDAYRRLRESGAKPKTIAGSATLEREARAPIEVERGYLIRNDRLRREVQTAHDNAPPPSVA